MRNCNHALVQNKMADRFSELKTIGHRMLKQLLNLVMAKYGDISQTDQVIC